MVTPDNLVHISVFCKVPSYLRLFISKEFLLYYLNIVWTDTKELSIYTYKPCSGILGPISVTCRSAAGIMLGKVFWSLKV
jgi:hypothetical protein